MTEKLLILNTNLMIKGGTNRIIAELVWNLHKECDIVLLSLEGQGSGYQYPDNVRIISLENFLARSKSRVLRTINAILMLPTVARIIKYKRANVVMSFLPRANIVNIIVKKLFCRKYKCIITEQNYNSIQYNQTLAGRILLRVMKKLYPQADIVITNACGLADNVNRYFGVPVWKTKVIYSPFDLEKIDELSHHEVDHPWFHDNIPVLIHAARLIEQKNQQLLLRAFAKVRNKTSCRLLILGEGPLEESLKETARLLGIIDDVDFLGWRDNIFNFMHKAVAFVLTSNYEGLPSVLIQAMACGCPVVSTDCPSGPREILKDGKYGFLVPMNDEETLSKCILNILNDNNLGNNLSLLGKKRSKDFGIEIIAEEYKGVIQGVIGYEQ